MYGLQILALYNVKFLWIDGDLDYAKRAAIVKDFVESKDIMVLIFSSVGSVGLNLSCANYIVFLVCFISYF